MFCHPKLQPAVLPSFNFESVLVSRASPCEIFTISSVRDKGIHFSQTKPMIIASIIATLAVRARLKELLLPTPFRFKKL